MTILVLTVGGSHQPLVTAIETQKPDFIVFLCSDDTRATKGSYLQVVGEGKVIKSRTGLEKPDLPNIATLTGLKPDQYQILKIRNFDNLEDCYQEASRAISSTRRRYPGARIIADYSGGTKSMTAGLALAAIDDEQCDVSLVTGTRADLNQVRDRTQFSRPIVVSDLRGERKMGEVRERLSRYDYVGAAALLETIAATSISEVLRERVTEAIAICRALDSWDRFQHEKARDLLEPYRKELIEHWIILDDLCQNERRDRYVYVEDLLLNAERCAVQGRYDDAVARNYRALELIAQTRLKTRYTLDTSDADPEKVPEGLRGFLKQYCSEDGRIRIPLFAAWTLLFQLKDEALGRWFEANKGKVQDFLGTRNLSILAHGNRPIGRSEFEAKGKSGIFLCREALASISAAERKVRAVPQLPTKLRSLEA